MKKLSKKTKSFLIALATIWNDNTLITKEKPWLMSFLKKSKIIFFDKSGIKVSIISNNTSSGTLNILVKPRIKFNVGNMDWSI